jgi:hypothetical protein
LYESWSYKREDYCAWWAQPYAKNSRLVIGLVNIFICNPFTRDWKNILDVPSIHKPIYDVKALTFDEASKKFKFSLVKLNIYKEFHSIKYQYDLRIVSNSVFCL